MNFEDIDDKQVEQWASRGILDSKDLLLIWLTEILNGSYKLEDARNDILSFQKTTDLEAK